MIERWRGIAIHPLVEQTRNLISMSKQVGSQVRTDKTADASDERLNWRRHFRSDTQKSGAQILADDFFRWTDEAQLALIQPGGAAAHLSDGFHAVSDEQDG